MARKSAKKAWPLVLRPRTRDHEKIDEARKLTKLIVRHRRSDITPAQFQTYRDLVGADSDEARPPIPFQRRPCIPIRSRPSFRSDGGRVGVIPTGHLCSLTKCRCRSSRRLTLAQ